MTKYQQYYLSMLEENKKVFDEFKPIHDRYVLDPKRHQEEFNRAGQPIMDILHDWEKRLCSHSEKSQFGKFSSQLSDKFWNEVRKHFPQIDWIGVKIS